MQMADDGATNEAATAGRTIDTKGELPQFVRDLEFDPQKTALLLVDMQYCDAHRRYGVGKRYGAEHPELADRYFTRLEKLVVPNQVRLLEYFRSQTMRVVFVAIGSQLPDYSDLSPGTRRSAGSVVFFTGEFEYGLLPELQRRQDEPIINKLGAGAFNSSGIDHILRNMGIGSLVIGGVGTNACVETTARDAADRGYKCILVEDACASIDAEGHVATMRAFARMFGYVKTTEEVIREFTATRALTGRMSNQ